MEIEKQSIKNEQIVIGSCLKFKKIRKKLIHILEPNEFLADRHKVIWSALVALEERRLDYTVPTLASLITNESKDWGGEDYLKKLESIGIQKNIEFHIKRMRWDKIRLESLSNDGPELINMLKDPRTPSQEIIEHTSNLCKKFQINTSRSHTHTGKGLSSKYSASIRSRQVGTTFRSTGFKSLNKRLSLGMSSGTFSVIAGAPSMGKTTFALNMAVRQVPIFKVAYLAWEGGKEAAIDTMVASTLKIPLERLIKYPHLLTKEEEDSIDEFTEKLFYKNKLIFIDPPPKSIFKGRPWDVNTRILEWVEEQLSDIQPDICYWDLFERKLPAKDNSYIELALDYIQEMVKPERLNTHMCLLHQIRFKDVEKRENQRPTREGLKGSGGYIEVPDLVFGLYRPAVYEEDAIDDTIEIICLKQRRGKFPWKVALNWDGTKVRVWDGKRKNRTPVVTIDPIIPERKTQQNKNRKREDYNGL